MLSCKEPQLQLPQHQRLEQQLAQMHELELGLMQQLQQYGRQDRRPQQQAPPCAPAYDAAAAALSSQLKQQQQQQQQQQQFTQVVLSAFAQVLQQLPALQPREASNILWAACKLQQPPAAPQLKQLLAHISQPAVLRAANAQDVSMALYAAAALGLQVAEQQLEALLAAAAANMHGAAPQALANTLWAVATLQYRPQEQWLSTIEQRCCSLLQQQASQQDLQQQLPRSAAAHQAQFTCKGLHQLLWSMAKLQWLPDPQFLTLFWAVSGAQLPQMTPHGMSGILWAAASLEVAPAEGWVQSWLQVTQQQLAASRFGDQDVANALWGVVKLRVSPSQSWLGAAMAGSGAVLAGAGSQELSMMLWAWAKLGVKPQQQWMQGWLQAMAQRMSSAYALALLRFRPGRAWCEGLVGEAQRQLAAFGAQELANLAWALAVLGLRPGRAWMRDFQSQALSESGSFNAQELSLVCWSLARLGHTPPLAWVALVRWDLPELKEAGKYRMLLPRYWAASQQLLPSCSLSQLSVLWWARARLGCMPSRAWSGAFWAAAAPALAAALDPTASDAEAAAAAERGVHNLQLVSSVAVQAAQPAPDGASTTAAAAAAACARRDVLSPAVVVRLIWATGKMDRCAPGLPGGLLLLAAQRTLAQCSCEGLTALGLGLVRMQRAALAAAPAVGQGTAAQAVQGQQGSGCDAAALGQQAAFWESWFARSSRLLQQDSKVAAQLRLQQQQGHLTAQVDVSVVRPAQLQQPAEELQQQQRCSIHSADVSLQLFIAAHLRLAPPAGWSRLVLAATAAHVQSMSPEQLSWVVWSVSRLGLGTQLPPGWLRAVLTRVGSVCGRLSSGSGSGSGAVASLLRLGKAMRRLRAAQCVGQQEWQLWLLLAQNWRTTQGMA
ncbi:hypothetical protein COO60DRAFT_1641492 [Scenedesmus sp. NREL 46B-D3]|nr:hypothetical protein COO60DRAFT_1641492 [Scenedesmus sp. NREL 46B-D3]